MKLNLQKIATFLGILALLGSWAVHFGDFYFSTEFRLEKLEESVLKLEKKVNRSQKRKKIK